MQPTATGLTAANALSAACLLTMLAMPAMSHHSFAMYDQTVDLTLTGKLTRFIPGGNHAQLLFELIDENGNVKLIDGKPDLWGVETGPAAAIAREGITVETFPIGTVMTVTLNPLRDGRPFGALARGGVIVKCGMQLPDRGCNEDTGEAFLGAGD